MRQNFNSIYENKDLIRFFDDWESWSQDNPFVRGFVFEVEMLDDATGDSEVFFVWAEDEVSLSDDIASLTNDDRFYSQATTYIKKIRT